MTLRPTLLLALVLLAACTRATPASGPPTSELATGAPTSRPATGAPTSGPTTTPPAVPTATAPPPRALFERRWAQASLPSVLNGAVHTEDGWVGVGDGCGGGCDEFDEVALHSTDGVSWTDQLMGKGMGAYLIDVVRTGDRLFALGWLVGGPEGDDRSRATVWRSTDGRAWEHISTVDLGACGTDGCLVAQTISASVDGDLVVGATSPRGLPIRNVFRSSDGISWTAVPTQAFGAGAAPFRVVQSLGAGATTVLAGACADCPVTVWSSPDGARWDVVGRTTGPTPSFIDLATDGRALLLAQEVCVSDEEDEETCAMTLWTGPLGGPLRQTAPDLQVRRPRLAFVDGVAVLAGQTPMGPRIYASTDRLAWTEQPSTLDFAGCTIRGLVPAPGALLLHTDADCAMAWLGRVRS